MKHDIKAEDCDRLCELIEYIALGVEQGIQSRQKLKEKAAELRTFLKERGYTVSLAYILSA